MRILGIDYGSVRIGLALSDETQTLAREYAIWSPPQFWQEISQLITKEQVERIVVGLPLNMSGQASQKTIEVQGFHDRLQQTVTLPVEFMDERLSSVMAKQLPGGKTNVDSLAAQIILQNYLDKINKN